MKTIPPVCSEPETGPKYWRSLDQLAERPEFRQWLDREFPSGASIAPEGETRRDWMKLMSASFLLAGLGGVAAGCRRPEEVLTPFAKQPENYIHGGWQYFATSMPTRGTAVSLAVKSSDGRPTKVEPNDLHPDAAGTDLLVQGSILNLYDPDRAHRHAVSGADVKVEKVRDALADLARKFAASGGEGLQFLSERSSSPTRARLQARLAEKLPRARWTSYEPVDFDIHRNAAGVAFGADLRPYYQLAGARRILSLDADLFGAEQDANRLMRGFARGRKASDAMNRLYVVESLFTLTGGQADHRLRVKPTDVLRVAAHVASFIVTGGELGASLKKLSQGSPASAKWAEECAKDLVAAGGESVVVAGYAQPVAVHLIALAINHALGAVGMTVFLHAPVQPPDSGTLTDLVKALNGGSVDTLVILGGNPAYNAPSALKFSDAAKKAKTVVRLGYYEDETASLATWHLAAAHYLESWGDARTSDGTVVPIQPLIEPLFGGLTEIEVLARLLGEAKPAPYELVRETFKTLGGEGDGPWKKFLHDGFLAGSAARPVAASLDSAAIVEGLSHAPAAPAAGYQVVLYRDAKVDDGRFANNGWLQELPDPVTKLVWGNSVMVSPATGKKLGVTENGTAKQQKNGKNNSDDSAHAHDGQFDNHIVRVTVGGQTIEGPVWIQPGLADDTIALGLGYGRRRVGRVGSGCGFDVYGLYATAGGHIVTGATAAKISKKALLGTTQEHGLMEGRPVIREANLAQYKSKPDFAKGMDLDGHLPHYVPYNDDGSIKNIYTHPYKANPETKSEIHQWGMTIDLASCVGCAACVIACQSENNIPIVGKDQVMRGREMHWIRIDRYYSHDADLEVTQEHVSADPQMAIQPMLCQHCEAAPCESVCPVNATVHDEEGLNVMAYNRCIGTRYCANNCPFKVRRFNFFDFNKRENDYAKVQGQFFFNTGNLYKGPLAENRNESPDWEIVKLVKNPDVTVRMRGVMEKCTFCVQRIEQAKIAQKGIARDSANVRVPDGGVKTACQQACPAEAITFGNLLDPESAVSKLKKDPRDYTVLGFLDIRPRVTYLARVRNPNPAMPDAKSKPDSLRDYKRFRDEDPFTDESGHGKEGHHAAVNAAPKGDA